MYFLYLSTNINTNNKCTLINIMSAKMLYRLFKKIDNRIDLSIIKIIIINFNLDNKNLNSNNNRFTIDNFINFIINLFLFINLIIQIFINHNNNNTINYQINNLDNKNCHYFNNFYKLSHF